MTRVRRGLLAVLLAFAAVASACTSKGADPPPQLGKTLVVTSPALSAGETVPAKYTCDGENVSPPLAWTAGGEDAFSYAIVVSDPDAPDGTFIHWVAFAIDRSVMSVPEGIGGDVATMGTNGLGDLGYSGPCPPQGDAPHRYRFSVYAMGRLPELTEGATWKQLLHEIDRWARAEGTLEVRYGR